MKFSKYCSFADDQRDVHVIARTVDCSSLVDRETSMNFDKGC